MITHCIWLLVAGCCYVVVVACKASHVNATILRYIVTERRGRVVNTPTSYSGGPGFDYRPRRSAILTESFRGFSQSLQANSGIVP
jgi:hypothetical protein